MMFGAGWMNLTSLGLGLAAWALPLAALALRKRAAGRLCPALVWASAAACGAALYLQICYQNHLVQIHDVGAILDTTDALVFVAGVLPLRWPFGAQKRGKAAQMLDAARICGYNAVAS